MARVRYHGVFDAKGKLQASAFANALNAFASRRVPVVLTVEEDKGKRTNPQNKYYWGVVIELIGQGLKDAGWDPRECIPNAVHETMRMRFLTTEKAIGDGVVTRIRSTTELNIEEFGAYLEHCIRFAAEYLNVVIPEPGEQMELIT